MMKRAAPSLRLNLVLLAIVLFLSFLAFSRAILHKEAYIKPKIEVNYNLPQPSNITVEIKKNERSVLFEQAHQDKHSIYKDYTKFASLFGESGSPIMSIDSKRLSTTGMEGVDIIVLLMPNTSYSDEEMGTILDSVKKGTTLIIIGDRGVQDTLNRLGISIGITFNDDYIYDLENYFEFYKNPIVISFASNITENSADNLTKNISRIAIYDGCSLDTFFPAAVVAFGSDSTKSSADKGKIGAIAVSSLGSGKIFAICDADIFSDANIKELDNENLARNLVNWS